MGHYKGELSPVLVTIRASFVNKVLQLLVVALLFYEAITYLSS